MRGSSVPVSAKGSLGESGAGEMDFVVATLAAFRQADSLNLQ